MRACGTRVRMDEIQVDVCRALLLEVADDAPDAAGLGRASVPSERQQLDETAVAPVGAQIRGAGVVPGIALDDEAEEPRRDPRVRVRVEELGTTDLRAVSTVEVRTYRLRDLEQAPAGSRA